MCGSFCMCGSGKKELIRGAGAAGSMLGRAVVRLQQGRDNLTSLIQSNDVTKVHPELRTGFQSFIDLRRELNSATVNPVHSMQSMIMNSPAGKDGSLAGKSYTPRRHPHAPKPAELTSQSMSAPTGVPRPTGVPATAPAAAPKEPESALLSSVINEQKTARTQQVGESGKRVGISSPVTGSLPGGADILLESLEQQRALAKYERYVATQKS
mmetsp:Transcript_1351/g.2086  ORF Transcript_1351/g.2086 Transcript_1351/m.2086 type:complete len:211 (-) Transcript_1351:113-745(-)